MAAGTESVFPLANPMITFYVRPSRGFGDAEGALESIEPDDVHLYRPDEIYICLGDVLPAFQAITTTEYYDNPHIAATAELKNILQFIGK